MATNYNGYVIDAQGNATPISDPHALQRGESVERADVAANAEMLGGMLPSEFAKAGEGGITMELLWENASPNSEFDAQTVALDLTDYQFAGLVSKWVASDSFSLQSMDILTKGTGMRYVGCVGAGSNVARRIDEITDSGINFGPSFSGNENPIKTTMIPVMIYGIKGVS